MHAANNGIARRLDIRFAADDASCSTATCRHDVTRAPLLFIFRPRSLAFTQRLVSHHLSFYSIHTVRSYYKFCSSLLTFGELSLGRPSLLAADVAWLLQ